MSAKTYLCIQRSQPGKPGGSPPSPAKMEEMYARFDAWKTRFESNILDMGGPLRGGAVVTSETVSDGPFMEAKEVVGGFMIVTADSLEEAIEVAQQSPGVMSPGSSVEVREIGRP